MERLRKYKRDWYLRNRVKTEAQMFDPEANQFEEVAQNNNPLPSVPRGARFDEIFFLNNGETRRRRPNTPFGGGWDTPALRVYTQDTHEKSDQHQRKKRESEDAIIENLRLRPRTNVFSRRWI